MWVVMTVKGSRYVWSSSIGWMKTKSRQLVPRMRFVLIYEVWVTATTLWITEQRINWRNICTKSSLNNSIIQYSLWMQKWRRNEKQISIYGQLILLLQMSILYNLFCMFNLLQSTHQSTTFYKFNSRILNNRFLELQENSYKNNIKLYYSTGLTMRTTGKP